MRRSSFALAILFISVMVIGIIDALPADVSAANYIAEGNAHFRNGELSLAWDAFKMAENLAIANNNFAEQVDVVNARLSCSAGTTDPYYQETFGAEAYDQYEKLLQSAIEKTSDPRNTAQGQNELSALAGLPGPLGVTVGIPPGPFGSRDRILASQQDANDALRTPTPTPAASTVCSWGGTWVTDWGDMRLSESAGKVTGNYDWDGGQISGEVLGVYTLSGTWIEKNPDSKILGGTPHDRGQFIFTLSNESCKSFTGMWNYDDAPDWRSDWTGTKK